MPLEVSMGKRSKPSAKGQRQQFSKDFKIEAVRLLKARTEPAETLALRLGVRRNQLYKWQAELQAGAATAFPGPGAKPVSELSEVERLRRELKRVTEERDILKKAEAYFAKLRR